MKPNNNFTFSVNDIEIIETALRNKMGRRGMAMLKGQGNKQMQVEARQLQDLLGRIHHQKNHYAKFKDGTTYVSG